MPQLIVQYIHKEQLSSLARRALTLKIICLIRSVNQKSNPALTVRANAHHSISVVRASSTYRCPGIFTRACNKYQAFAFVMRHVAYMRTSRQHTLVIISRHSEYFATFLNAPNCTQALPISLLCVL